MSSEPMQVGPWRLSHRRHQSRRSNETPTTSCRRIQKNTYKWRPIPKDRGRMDTYHVPCQRNSTYTSHRPPTGDTECTSQDDTTGCSCSHRTLGAACLFELGSTSCNTNRLASWHPTSHRPLMSFMGVSANGFSSLILTLDTSRIGHVVHDCASRADFTSTRSRDAVD